MHESGDCGRNLPFRRAEQTALLVVDVQGYVGHPQRGMFARADVPEAVRDAYFDRLRGTVLPNIAALADACRDKGAEVLYTVIESLTRDGRERSLDHKISGIFVAPGSPEARVLPEVAPRGDEMVIPKTSSSVFCSTNIDYILRNLGIRQLMIVGLFTEQCVLSAVRDAADLGYLVTVAADACASLLPERHEMGLKLCEGYARVLTTADALAELSVMAARG